MKKVRYLTGVAGLAPAAFGLAMQGPPAVAATTHTVVPDASCKGHTPHQRTIHAHGTWITVGFWSATHGTKTCIGDIWVHAGAAVNSVIFASLHGKDGDTYCQKSGPAPLEYGCHGSFYRPFSIVATGFWNQGNSSITVPYTVG